MPRGLFGRSDSKRASWASESQKWWFVIEPSNNGSLNHISGPVGILLMGPEPSRGRLPGAMPIRPKSVLSGPLPSESFQLGCFGRSYGASTSFGILLVGTGLLLNWQFLSAYGSPPFFEATSVCLDSGSDQHFFSKCVVRVSASQPPLTSTSTWATTRASCVALVAAPTAC
jgi:hypothetical protein